MEQLPDICLGFEVHQPYRIAGGFNEKRSRRKKLSDLYDVYLDTTLDKMVLERVCRKCYLPANEIMLKNIERFKGEEREFKVVYSLSGVLVEQLRRWAPNALDSFIKLVDTGCVELLDQTLLSLSFQPLLRGKGGVRRTGEGPPRADEGRFRI